MPTSPSLYLLSITDISQNILYYVSYILILKILSESISQTNVVVCNAFSILAVQTFSRQEISRQFLRKKTRNTNFIQAFLLD